MKYSFPVRLDKFLGNAGFGTRKEIRQSIRNGLVKVNGTIASDPAMKITEQDQVIFDEEMVRDYRHHYLMFHKPAGYVCSHRESEGPTIFDLIDHPIAPSLQIVGRLDRDVTGLVILTTDGDFNHSVTAPRKMIPKCYRITLAEPLSEKQIRLLFRGVQIEPEYTVAILAFRKMDPLQAELVVHQGKFHLIKKMMKGIGAELVHLHRIQIGALRLPDDLEEGEYRELTPREKDLLTVPWNDVQSSFLNAHYLLSYPQ